jgi:SAM-dependent methyltransferase
LTQDHLPYMNYGMFCDESSPDYVENSEEEINYLELFGLCRSLLRADLNFLEIGCGLGHGAQLIRDNFRPSHILAIDRSRNAILYAQKNLNGHGITYLRTDFSDGIASHESFDVIYTVESGGLCPKQEHFEDAYRLLKKNGILLVANINTTNELAKKREFARRSGFLLYREKDVTQQVSAYLQSEKKARRLHSAIEGMPFHKYVICKLLSNSIREAARMPGSKSYNLLGSREFYYHFCFIKP